MRSPIKFALGPLMLLALDAAIFRSGWYAQYLEPSSSAGTMELTLLRERKHQAEWKEPLILTMGDSRMNYSPKQANKYCQERGYPFRLTHGGVAGTNPRVWHYLLRELDPTARRYSAIVFPVDDYDDEDTFQDFSDYPLDVNYLAMLLRWTDALEYPGSYTSGKYAREAWKACLLKGAAMQPDLLALLKAPNQRLKSAALNRDWWPNGSYEFLEEDKTVAGLSIDWKTRKAVVPPGVDPRVVDAVLLKPTAPQTGRFGEYRRKWFGQIFSRYVASETKIIFVKLPRGPIVRPPVITVSHSLRESGKLLGQEDLFEELERPEFFKDPLHMNRAGAKRYADLLVDDLARMLGAL